MNIVDIIKSIEGTDTGALVALVLAMLSAMAHALFGAVLKSGDPILNRGAINVCYGVVAAPLALFVAPWPSDDLWPILFAVYLIHFAYEWFQAKSFEHGAFVLVYPIGRGSGPLLIALAALFVFGERLAWNQWFGILLISGGILALAQVNLRSAVKKGENMRGLRLAIGFALGTGVLIAVYTTVDAYGIRLADNPFTFLAWFFFTGLFSSPIIAILKYRRLEVPIDKGALFARGLLGAMIAVISFGSVMLATRLGQVATVAALRETSIIFATALGVYVFKEQVTASRLLLIGLIAFGAVMVEL
ncbi:MAG: DMT family transporter [Hyphomicrobiales bacterium]